MISETLAAELEQYRIGPKVRALRKAKKLGLVQLGEHSGLSPGLLSKIERGQLVPTLPTLLRIALVFGVGLEHFFAPRARRPWPWCAGRIACGCPTGPATAAPSYFFESLDFPVTDRQMEAYLAEFPAGARPSAPHDHDGAEFVYVIAGRLAIEVGDTTVELAEGDAVYFDSGNAAQLSPAGERTARGDRRRARLSDCRGNIA